MSMQTSYPYLQAVQQPVQNQYLQSVPQHQNYSIQQRCDSQVQYQVAPQAPQVQVQPQIVYVPVPVQQVAVQQQKQQIKTSPLTDKINEAASTEGLLLENNPLKKHKNVSSSSSNASSDKKTYLWGLIKVSSDEDYDKAVNWDIARFGWSLSTLQIVRVCMLSLIWLSLMTSLLVNRMDYTVTYATEWGMHIGWLHFYIVIRCGGTINSFDVQAKKRGLIWSEIAIGFGFLVTLIFWINLAPQIYPHLDPTDPYLLFIAIYYFVIHVFPFSFTVLNLVFTKVTLLENDWWIPALVWAAYCVVDCIACIHYGNPLYPGWDWNNNFPQAVLISIALTLFTGLLYYIFALVFNHFAKR